MYIYIFVISGSLLDFGVLYLVCACMLLYNRGPYKLLITLRRFPPTATYPRIPRRIRRDEYPFRLMPAFPGSGHNAVDEQFFFLRWFGQYFSDGGSDPPPPPSRGSIDTGAPEEEEEEVRVPTMSGRPPEHTSTTLMPTQVMTSEKQKLLPNRSTTSFCLCF